jgi:hypothetical protein
VAEEFTLKLPNAKTFDALDAISQAGTEAPAVRAMAVIVRDLADAIIVLSKIIAASNKGVRITRNADGVGGE